MVYRKIFQGFFERGKQTLLTTAKQEITTTFFRAQIDFAIQLCEALKASAIL